MDFLFNILSKKKTILSFRKGDFLFEQGQSSNGIYILKCGRVKIIRNDSAGNSLFLWYARENEIIGLTSYFQGGGIFSYSAEIWSKSCEAYYISNHEFTSLLSEFPVLKDQIVKMLCRRINFIEMQTKNILAKNQRQRLIDLFLFLAYNHTDSGKVKENDFIRLNYSIKEVAEMTGASIEYLKSILKELQSEKLVDYNKRSLTLNNLDKLKKYQYS